MQNWPTVRRALGQPMLLRVLDPSLRQSEEQVLDELRSRATMPKGQYGFGFGMYGAGGYGRIALGRRALARRLIRAIEESDSSDKGDTPADEPIVRVLDKKRHLFQNTTEAYTSA